MYRRNDLLVHLYLISTCDTVSWASSEVKNSQENEFLTKNDKSLRHSAPLLLARSPGLPKERQTFFFSWKAYLENASGSTD